MFRLGITGGIGSGKSTVCKIFNVLGIPHFSADDSARSIMDNDSRLKQSLNNLAGKDLYHDGKLDRKLLADLIFNNNEMLERVNALVHPLVFRDYEDWCSEQSSDYVIMEAAILYESGGEKYTDRVAAVIAPVEERIMRVVERNTMTREEVASRIKNQAPENELVGRADYIIDNSENRMVLPQVLTIHNEILDWLRNKNYGKV
jgi:dephospho-CoA kinase